MQSSQERKPPSPVVVNAGDELSIHIFPVEEYSKEIVVAPDGRIEMPLIGSLLVKGLTTLEIQELMQRKYARFIANPQISINVRRFSGRRVAILGDVHSPGHFEYRDGMKVLELVAMANGFNDSAVTKRLWILRVDADGKNSSFRVNYDKVLRGDPTRDVKLEAGDTVFVPRSNLTSSSSWLSANVLPWVTLTATVLTVLLAEKALNHN